MDQELRAKIMPRPLKLILAILLALLLLVLSIGQIVDIKSKLQSQQSQRTITVSGEGKVIGVPDVALINFSVVTDKPTAKEAMTENAKKMNEIIKFIKDFGVDEKDVKTTGYYLNPLYDYVKGVRTSMGYELTSTLTVKVRALEKTSTLIDGAVIRGANQVGDIQFNIDQPEKLKAEARDKAILQAKDKAKEIAKTSGFRLGKIVSFSESGGDFYPVPMLKEAAPTGGGAITPQVEKGSQEIDVTISFVFEIK